jgi:hypothetical protein
MAITNPFANAREDAPLYGFDLRGAYSAGREDPDEGGGGMGHKRALYSLASYLGNNFAAELREGVEFSDRVTPPNRLFNIEEMLGKAHPDPDTGEPVLWSSEDAISFLTGIPKRNLAELLGIAAIEKGPRAVAAGVGMRTALQLGAPAIMKAPGVLGKVAAGVGVATTGAWAAVTALEEANKVVEEYTGFGLPEAPDVAISDQPFLTGAGYAMEFGAISGILRGAGRKLPEVVDLGASKTLEGFRRQNYYFQNKMVDPAIGAIPTRPSRLAPLAGRFIERQIGQFGRLSRGDIPGFWVQEGAMAAGTGVATGVAEAVDPGDPLSQFVAMLLGPVVPTSLAARLIQRGTRPLRTRWASAEGDTRWQRAKSAVAEGGEELAAEARTRAEHEASREVDQWIESVKNAYFQGSTGDAAALRTTYAAKVAEIPETFPAAERASAIETIQNQLSESSGTPLPILKEMLLDEGSSYVPLTRQSIAKAVLEYRTVLEEKFPGMPLDEIMKLQLPGQISDPERMPLSLVVEALTQKDLAVSRRAVQGRPLGERTGEAMALETGQAMDKQESLLASHLQNQLLTAGGDYNIQLATLLSRAIFEDQIENTYLRDMLSNVELIDRYLQPETPGAIPKGLEISRISGRRGAFDYLPAEKANEFLFKSIQNLYDDLANESTGPVSELARQIPNNKRIVLDSFIHTYDRLKQEIGLVSEVDPTSGVELIQDYSGSRGSTLAILDALRRTDAPNILHSVGVRPLPQLTPLRDLKDKYEPLIQQAKENIVRYRTNVRAESVRGTDVLMPWTKEQLRGHHELALLDRLPIEKGASLPFGLSVVSDTGPTLKQLETALLAKPIRDELRAMRDSLVPGGQLTGTASPGWFRNMQVRGTGEYKSSIAKTGGIIDKLLTPMYQLGARESRIAEYLINTAVARREKGIKLSPSMEQQIEGYTGYATVSLNSLIEWQAPRGRPFREDPALVVEVEDPYAVRAQEYLTVPGEPNVPFEYLHFGDPAAETTPFIETLAELLKDLDALKNKGIDISPRQALAMFDDADVAKRAVVEAGPVSLTVKPKDFLDRLGVPVSDDPLLFYDPVTPSPVTVGDVRTLIRSLGEVSKDLSGSAAKTAGLWIKSLRQDLKDLAEGNKMNPETGELYSPDPALLNFNSYFEGLENIFSRSSTGKKRSQLENLPPPSHLLDPRQQQVGPTPEYMRVILELAAMLQEAKLPALLGKDAMEGLSGEVRESALALGKSWVPQITSFAEVVDDLFRGALANDVFEVMNQEGVRIPLRDLLPKEVILPKPEGTFLTGADQLANALERDVFPGANKTPFNIIRVNQRKLSIYADNLRKLILSQTGARKDPDAALMAPEILNRVEGVLSDFGDIQKTGAMIEALTNSDSDWARAIANEKSLDALYAVTNTQAALAGAIRSRSPQDNLMTYIKPLQRLRDSELTFTDNQSNMEVRGKDIHPQLRDGFYNDIIAIALEESGLFRRPGEPGADLEVVPYRDRRRKPGFHPAQFIKDFLFNTSNAKTPAGKLSPYAKYWPKPDPDDLGKYPPLFDFLSEHGMLPEGEPEQLRKQIKLFLDSLIELDEVFRGIREAHEAENLQIALLGTAPDEPQTIFGGKFRTRVSGLVGASAITKIWKKVGRIIPFLSESGGVAIPGIGASMGRDVLGQTPRSLALPFVQNLFRPGRQEELAAFLASPSGPSESILQRMLAALTGGSPHLLTAIQAYLNSEDPLEEERGWPERLGLSEEGALGSMLPPPPPPPEPVPTAQAQLPPPPPMAQAQPPPAPMAQMQPSPASPAMRSQYAAMFPFDPASAVVRQQQARAQAPAQQGIGSLV